MSRIRSIHPGIWTDEALAAGVVSDDSMAEEVRAKWSDNLGGPAVVVLIARLEDTTND